MITCKLTKKVGEGVKSHIIPESFYEFPPQKEGPYRLVTNRKNIRPKKSPIGVYDKLIVTKEGEKKFDSWDGYAAQLLIEGRGDFIQVERNRETVAFKVSNYDYEKLKLFALSVLWRANVSSHIFFCGVRLGKHEPVIREMLLNGDPGESEVYSVNIARWKDNGIGPVFMNPFREKYKGVNYYRMYCGRYVLYVKVDQRRSPDPFNKLQLAQGRELYIIMRNLRNSNEWPVMGEIASAVASQQGRMRRTATR